MTDTPVSMVAALPTPGQDPWDADLNAVLTDLQTRVTTLEAKKDHISQIAAYTFNVGMPPAAADQVRLNNTVQTQATQIDLRSITSDGLDLTPWWQIFKAGSIVRMSDYNDATSWQSYVLTADAVIGATNTTMAVAWQKGGNTIPSGKTALFMVTNVPT